MALTFPQTLLQARLIVCCDVECETIRDVFNDIKKRHKENPDLNYWFHPDFLVPLKTFVKWFNEQHPQYTVKKSEAREVLEKLYDSD